MLGVVGLWSIIPVLVKTALHIVDPFSLAFLRLTLGAGVMIATYGIRGGDWRTLIPRDRRTYIAGAGLSLNYICFGLAFDFTSAGLGGLVIQIQFVALALLAVPILRERLGLLKALGMATVIAGVVLVFGARGDLSDVVRVEYARGNAIMLIAGFAFGVYGVSVKSISTRKGNLELLIPILAIAIVATGTVAAIRFEFRGPITLVGVGAIVILGALCTGVSFVLVSEGLRRLSAALAGTITAATTLINLLLARWILKEPLTSWMLLSALLVVSGICGIAYSEWREKNSKAAADRRSG